MSVDALISEVVKSNVSPEIWNWLQEKSAPAGSSQSFLTAFAAAPRKVGKFSVHGPRDLFAKIEDAHPGFTIRSWTMDRVTRVWLLSQLNPENRETYINSIENIFRTAEMHEQVALYSSLPLLHYPDAWRHRCTEGIRSNIGVVLESIMCDNPYPAAHLTEAEWNQMVLKAFFTEKPINRIVGLDQRANPTLAFTLSDYAHERWAAHRTVNPMLWRCVAPFVDEKLFPDIERIAASHNDLEVEAAALVIRQNAFAKLNQLPERFASLKKKLNETISWDLISEKLADANQK